MNNYKSKRGISGLSASFFVDLLKHKKYAMEKFNAKEHFKATLMIFTAMLGGIFIFAMLSLYLNYGKKEPVEDVQTYLIISIALGFVALFAGSTISKGVIKRALGKSFQAKMDAYRSATLIKISFLEGAALFSIVTYLLTANMMLLVVGALMAVVFRYHRPTPMRIAKTMQLKKEEALQLT